MDADKRHQLKTNELAEALGKIRDFWSDPQTRYWVLAIVVVLAAYTGYRFWRRAQVRHVAQSSLMLAQVDGKLRGNLAGATDELRAMIDSAPNPATAARARIRLAAALRRQAEESFGDQAVPLLQESVATLKPVVDDPEMPAPLLAAAAYSLGTSYESLHQLDAATELYQLIAEEERFAGSPFVLLAQGRLETMDGLRVPVQFEPGLPPLPASQPAEPTPQPTGPTSQPGSAPAGLQEPAGEPAPAEPFGPLPPGPPTTTEPPAGQPTSRPGGTEAP